MEKRLSAYFDQLGTMLWDCRQRHCLATYASGLMSKLERKSLEPIAAWFTTNSLDAERLHQRLHNFVADAPWPDDQLRLIAARYGLSALLKRGPVRTWICDETSFLKSGNHSVGVQRQYCRVVGKVANCQVAPSLVIASKYAHLPIDMTLYLGTKWTEDLKRRRAARVPVDLQFQTKPQLMLGILRQARANGIPAGVVLGRSEFGDSLVFRAGVRALDLHYALRVHRTAAVCRVNTAGVAAPQSIEQIVPQLPSQAFQRYGWSEGNRGQRSARFAFLPVRLPGEPLAEILWLVVEWGDSEPAPSRVHLSSLPPSTRRVQLVQLVKELWRTDQVYREMTQELGLGQYEGRKWRGFAHHLTVVLCCYAFLVGERDGIFSALAPAPASGSAELNL